MIRDGHIVVEEVCIRGTVDFVNHPGQVTWDGYVATITDSDGKASEEWISAHSLLPRLSIKHNNLYWDGKKVDLGKVIVFGTIEQAIPWKSGVLVHGHTVPRRSFFQSWPFKGHFIEDRDIDPYCAIFFDPNTLRGEDLWLGKAPLEFFVFPIPD
jgi:hypothetical protein